MPAPRNRITSEDDGRCGYPNAQTDTRCRAWPSRTAKNGRCVRHEGKPGPPRGSMQGNDRAVTHGAFRRADLVLVDATDEDLDVFDRALADDPADLMLGALMVEYRRFLKRTVGDDDARAKGTLVFAEQVRKVAEARAKIRAAKGGGGKEPEGTADSEVAAFLRGARERAERGARSSE